jgi:hypothetical protein
MTMNKALSLALLGIGVVLLVLGVNASDSISSSFSRLFTGEPTDKTVWLLIGGCVATLVGLGGLRTGSK